MRISDWSSDVCSSDVKLGKAEPVGAVDDQRVGARNIEARFDDRRRYQHVLFAVVKGAHPLLDLARRHLAVGDDIFDLGHARSEGRRVWTECVSTCRSRRWPYH